jgi:hypothetical protein
MVFKERGYVMIKEGENIVLFKLRIKDELKQVELNNPELLEEYKASAIESIFNSARAEKISVLEARSAVEVIEPDYYGGKSLEQLEAEAKEDMKAAMPYIAVILLAVLGVGAFLVYTSFNLVISLFW